MRLINGCCNGGHLDLLCVLEVPESGGCGYEYFFVVAGFDDEDRAEALGLEMSEGSVVLWRYGSRLHAIGQHWYEAHLEDFESPLCVDDAVAPKLLQCFAACF